MLRQLKSVFTTMGAAAAILFAANVMASFLPEKRSPPLHDKPEELAELLPNLSKNEIADLVAETNALKWDFQPFVNFREKPRVGKYYNISEDGYRLSEGQKDLKFKGRKVFLFGGSALLGIRTPDSTTIASYLTTKVGSNTAIYNFGHAYYYSKQEAVLLLDLVTRGAVPDVAIFFDGVNERCAPAYVQQTARGFNAVQDRNFMGYAIADLGLGRLAKSINARLGAGEKSAAGGGGGCENRLLNGTGSELADIVEIYRHSVRITRAICEEYRIKCYHVLQPTPGYRGPQNKFANAKNDILVDRIKALVGANVSGVHDLTGIFERETTQVYIDETHYAPWASRRIADQLFSIARLGETHATK